MNRLLPKSLFGQTLLVLLAGLVVSLLVGSWIYTLDREQAVRAVGGLAAAQRIANLTKLVQDAPREWRGRIVAALSDQTFRVSLSAVPPAIIPNDDDAAVTAAIKEFLIDQLSSHLAGNRACRHRRRTIRCLGLGAPMMRPGPMMHGFSAFTDLVASAICRSQSRCPMANGCPLPPPCPRAARLFRASSWSQWRYGDRHSGGVVLGRRRVTAPLAALPRRPNGWTAM